MPKPKVQSWQARTAISLAIALTVAALMVLLFLLEDVTNLNLLGNAEAKLVDLRFRLRGPQETSGDVAVVAIDSKSIEAIGRWPWPRTIHAQLIDRLRDLGASAVVFGVLFTERQGAREEQRLRRIEEALDPDAEAARTAVAEALQEVLIDRQVASAMERTFDDAAALTALAFDFILPEDLVRTRELGDGERVARFDPTDGTMMIDFYGGIGTVPTYPYVDVLRDELRDSEDRPLDAAETLGGKLVFVGMSDPGLTRDTFTTPFTASLPGVEKHAMVAENLLHGRQLWQPRDAELVVILTAAALALSIGFVAGNLSAWWGLLVAAALGTGYLAKAYFDLTSQGLLWNWSVPLLTLIGGYGLVTAYRQISEQRARRQMEERGEFL